jgi:tRNA 2-thiouridine synthesizing protein A
LISLSRTGANNRRHGMNDAHGITDDENHTSAHDRELDARNLLCFMLTLRTKQALDTLKPGQVLRILTTDPGALNEFRAFTTQTGNELVASGEEYGTHAFLIRKH